MPNATGCMFHQAALPPDRNMGLSELPEQPHQAGVLARLEPPTVPPQQLPQHSQVHQPEELILRYYLKVENHMRRGKLGRGVFSIQGPCAPLGEVFINIKSENGQLRGRNIQDRLTFD